MGSKKTPLILQLRKIGGTLYCFPSASEDVGLNLQTTTSGVALTHYALLNIPKLVIDKCIFESQSHHTAITGNQALAMSLQNYMMNFETKLINEDNYNYQALNTVTEKVFWHWAKQIGIIEPNKFKNDKTGDSTVYYETGRDSSSLIKDDTVVKCFGSIDAGNSLSTEFGMYNETYINIPTSYGAGPVYFETSSDENYKFSTTHKVFDTTHLEGRGDEHKYYTYTNGQDLPYFDEKIGDQGLYRIGTGFEGITIAKDLSKILKYARKQFNNSNLIISSYDDLNVDINDNFKIDTEFEFNAILLYYSVYDLDDLIKTAYATNLFGIIFLDGTNEEKSDPKLDKADLFYIPTLTKRKSTALSFGNSYSFRVNLKTMSVYDNTDAIIQDNTTMASIASVDFSDVVSNLNVVIDTLNNNTQVIAKIQDNYAGILSYYDTLYDEIEDISTSLNAYLHGAKTSFIDTSILYVNEIRPLAASEENVIRFNTRKSNIKNANGTYDYNDDPTMEIIDDFVSAKNIYTDILINKESFIYVDNISTGDIGQITTTTLDNTVNEIINKMFSSIDELVIKQKSTKIDESNLLYIANDSNIFNREKTTSEKCISHLKDNNGNIDYVGFVPYIIGGMQLIYNKVKDQEAISYTYNIEPTDLDEILGYLQIGENIYDIYTPVYFAGQNVKIDKNNREAGGTINVKGYIFDLEYNNLSFGDLVNEINCKNAVAFGSGSAMADYSFAEGIHTTAYGIALHVFGYYNEYTDTSNCILVVGNGVEETRSNAMTLDNAGNMELAGDLTFNVIDAAIEDVNCMKKMMEYIKKLEDRIVILETANERLLKIAYEGI